MTASSPIPLWWPELTLADGQQVRTGLTRGRDEEMLAAWEGGWQQRWQRPALAFAHGRELWRCLRQVMGWPMGHTLWLDPFLHPLWREALADNGLSLRWLDVDQQPEPGATALIHHAFGCLRTPLSSPGWVVEEISPILLPRPGCGYGDVQIVHLQGMLQGGSSVVLLCQDSHLSDTLRQIRRHPPGGVVCGLGVSQWGRLEGVLARRSQLANRYNTLLRTDDRCCKPVGERVWAEYVLTCNSPEIREDLQAFFQRSAIGTASPVWFTLPEELTTARHFQQCSLALPLYAPLSDEQQKRVINRFHRWRQGMSMEGWGIPQNGDNKTGGGNNQ